MTTTEHVIDLTSLDRPDGAAHLLCLSLDLQLDALLLGVGAGAVQGPDRPEPWRRWVAEDVELTRLLAEAVLALGAELPSMLVVAPRGPDAGQVVQHLLARYESLSRLLAELGRPDRRRRQTDGAFPAAVQAAMTRCQTRTHELLRHLEAIEAQSGYATRPPARREYLPGELLG